MPMTHMLQGSRFELKYIISENCARGVRDFARTYLVPDEYARPEMNYEYAVHSLYLDSPNFRLCRSTLAGEKNRFKLRIRFYDEDPATPLFFEIKRRVDGVILKQRAAVRRSAINRLLAGLWPEPSDLVNPNPKSLGAVERFCSLRNRYRAVGQVFVSYMREAYVTPNDNSVRVTFDRQILASRFDDRFELNGSRRWIELRVGGVVLELKFTDRFPVWMREMARIYNLDRKSMAKYVSGVQALSRSELLVSPGLRGMRP